MIKFNFIQKNKFEKLFRMNSGYVLDFSDRTFQEFVLDAIGKDIYDEKYNHGSGSKANRLRGFWLNETNYNIGNLLDKLLEYRYHKIQMEEIEYDTNDEKLYKECIKIAEALKSEGPVENLDALKANSEEKDFITLAQLIRESIEKNEPENALDRLHTFTIKYIRRLCDNYEITYDKKKPLHSLFGEYIKKLEKSKIIESEMTKRILKSSISVLEAFNDVRNNRSFAHDNTVLNYHESILIFNNISNIIRFLEIIEKPKIKKDEIEKNWDNLPF